MKNVLFGDDQLDRHFHMKNAIGNRPAAKPGPVLRSKGPRSGSLRQSGNAPSNPGLFRSNSQRGQNDHFIKQNINQYKNKPAAKPTTQSNFGYNNHKHESDFLLGRI